jgi:tripeptidyl-peptidase-1
VCQQFAQLGARGVSLLFASGDGGVGSTGYCYPGNDSSINEFDPLFPASCPYVTAVGATKDFNPEVVAYDGDNGFVSGGGYSNYFPRPSYQDSAVTAYTKGLGNEFAGLYNVSGRAYPDIAAQGQRFATIWNGSLLILDGTSASTPAAASIISLVNDALLAAGKSPLGFLNPWLYATGHTAFNDITSGSALGCNTTGFPAKKGWDAVSGWGTPVRIFSFLHLFPFPLPCRISFCELYPRKPETN